MSELPLAGAVVLDLSDECLSLSGRLLADLGAEVVRVEGLGGDPLRSSGPHLRGRSDVESGLRHLLYNAGKRSLALAREAPVARELLDRALAECHLVIAPLDKSPAVRRLLDSDRLRRIHPQLGLVDVVFKRGREEVAPSDLTAVAAGGLMYGLGYPEEAPDYPAGRLAYKQAALVGAATATTMLYQIRRGQPAGHVTISLQEAIVSTTIHFANQNMWQLAGEKVGRPGGEVSTLLQAQDGGWLTFGITPNNPARWEAFGRWLLERAGYDGLVGADFPGDVWVPVYGDATHEALQRACASLPRDALCQEAQARGFLTVPINTVEDIATDPHLRERGFFVPVSHPQLASEIELPRLPIRSSAYEPVAHSAPALGAHSAATLADLAGVDPAEFARLREAGLVVGPDASVGPERPSFDVRNTDAPLSDALPLHGIRVVDFCWQAAGPLLTELLANLGADVIKIESEARLDTLRTAVQPVSNPTIETSAFFQDCNTDKRSITLNLRTPDGIRLIKELVRGADVVTENWSAGVLKRLGLGFEDLRTINPGIVVASLPVMGVWGPKATWRGIGNSVVALCGLAGHTGAPHNKPTGVSLHTDFTLAPLGVTAILAALLQRDRTGEGQEIELTQYEAGVHLLDTELIEYLANRTNPERPGNRSAEMAPHGLFPCAGTDRWIAIAIRDALDWDALCIAMNRTDLDSLRSLEARQAAEDELEAAIATWTAPQDAWRLEAELQAAGIPAGVLEDVEDLLADPSMSTFFHEFDHPAGVKFLAQNQPFLWNGTRLPIRRSPYFGEHNEVVFRDELGLSETEIERLLVEQVIY